MKCSVSLAFRRRFCRFGSYLICWSFQSARFRMLSIQLVKSKLCCCWITCAVRIRNCCNREANGVPRNEIPFFACVCVCSCSLILVYGYSSFSLIWPLFVRSALDAQTSRTFGLWKTQVTVLQLNKHVGSVPSASAIAIGHIWTECFEKKKLEIIAYNMFEYVFVCDTIQLPFIKKCGWCTAPVTFFLSIIHFVFLLRLLARTYTMYAGKITTRIGRIGLSCWSN